MSNNEVNPGYRTVSESNRAHDLGEMFHTLRTQGEDLQDLKKDMQVLNKLATAVELMAQKLDSLLEHNNHVQELRTRVSIHSTLITLFGTMCLAFMPLVVAWNYSLQQELKTLNNAQVRQSERLSNVLGNIKTNKELKISRETESKE